MSGGKGGSQTSKVEIPQWIEQPTIRNIARAEQVAQMGYQPYYGPEVAAFTPMQQQAMQSQYDAAAAFGMAPMGGNAMAGTPTPTEYTGGLLGYGSGDLFEQSINEFQKRQPDQAAIYSSQFVGPDVGNQDFYPPGNQKPIMGSGGGKGGSTPTGNIGASNYIDLNIPEGGGSGGFGGGYYQGGFGGMPIDYTTGQPFNPGNMTGPFVAQGMGAQIPGSPMVGGGSSGGMPAGGNYQDGIMYGQNMYNQGQTLQPGAITPPAQNEAMAMDLWSQAQGAMNSGSLSEADRFLTQYQNITGTREPMFGLGALDPSGYYASKNQGMTM